MSVLIRGMEMPKEKKISLTIFPDGRVYENHGERLWGHGKDCIPWKAVPVPPHGRLCDADGLAAECDAPYWCVWLSDIDAAPTIIPAEEGEA